MKVHATITKVQAFQNLPSDFEWDFRSRRFGDLAFSTQRAGWVLLDDLIFCTSDGGLTWNLDEAVRPGGFIPRTLFAVEPDSCWFTCSVTNQHRPTRIALLHAVRRHKSKVIWTGRTNGHYGLSRLFFISPERGWLISSESVDECEYGTIHFTKDAGQTWEVLSGRQPNVPTRIWFTSDLNGWQIARTQDQDPSRAFRVEIDDDSQTTLLIGGHTMAIRSTTDGGKSWNLRHKIERDLFGLTVTSENKILVVGASGTILASIDAGETWTQAASHTQSDIHALRLTPGGIGLAVGDEGLILVTNDHGNHWNPVTHRFPGASFHGVHFTSERSGVLVDPKGIYLFHLN
jgi:photosystem II stability/assembly factor-like uncharacterized protein